MKPQKGDRRTLTLKEELGSIVPAEPIMGLRVLPNGTLHSLTGKSVYSVGAADDARITLEDGYVSWVQFLLWRLGSVLVLEDGSSKNGTFINGMLSDGRVQLTAGDVITVGKTNLLVCGEAGAKQKIRIAGLDLDECLRNSAKLYGSQRRASEELNVPQKTMTRWLNEERFRSAPA